MAYIELGPGDDALAPALDKFLEQALLLAARRAQLPAEQRQPGSDQHFRNKLEKLHTLLSACRRAADTVPVYYDHPEQERLFNRDVNAAVAHILDDYYEIPEDYPETVTVGRFTKLVPSSPDYQYPSHLSPLSDLLERLDEEHMGYDEPSTVPTEAMKEAETRLVQTVIAEYRPYWHELTSTIEVPVRPWLLKNRPGAAPAPSFTTSVCGHCYRTAGSQHMRTCTACLRRGCSRCWRRAGNNPVPWPRRGPFRNSCGFRLDDAAEKRKEVNLYNDRSAHLGWGHRSEGPVNAE